MIGQEFIHPKHGKVMVLSKARTKTLVKETDRGPGWNEQLKRHIGVRTKQGWMRGENYTYGAEHQVYIKDLTPIPHETQEV